MTDPLWVGCHRNNFMAGRKGFAPEAIVIHIMDGTLAGNRTWFNDPAAKVSAHYGVGKDGAIHQYVRESDAAQHAGIVDRPSWPLLKARVNPNYYTIGIEHAGFDKDRARWPDAQMDASVALAAAIAGRWRIPPDDAHIVLHHEIRRSKPCPGALFDKADYLRRLGGLAPRHTGAAVAAFPRTVSLLKAAHLRREATSASASIRVLDAGTTFDAVAAADGEAVRGNGRWYRDTHDLFVWAGATDQP